MMYAIGLVAQAVPLSGGVICSVVAFSFVDDGPRWGRGPDMQRRVGS